MLYYIRNGQEKWIVEGPEAFITAENAINFILKEIEKRGQIPDRYRGIAIEKKNSKKRKWQKRIRKKQKRMEEERKNGYTKGANEDPTGTKPAGLRRPGSGQDYSGNHVTARRDTVN